MKATYINNRFLDDTTLAEIQSQSIEDLFEGGMSAKDKKRFDDVVDALVHIGMNRSEYLGLREAKSEDDFVSLLSTALNITRYAKPKIDGINRTPDFTFTRASNSEYMNLYSRSKSDFWKKTDLLVEIKPVGFLLEDYDPDTKRLWVDKCAWMQKASNVDVGLLTNFSTWYFIRNSQEDEAKYIAFFLDGCEETSSGDVLPLNEEYLRKNATAIAKMIFVTLNDELRERIKSDFESVDNEELDIADSLLPRFTDAISLILSESESEDGKLVREAMTQTFCIWSSLSQSEVLGLDLQKNLSLGKDYLEHFLDYLKAPSADKKQELDTIGSSVRQLAKELHQNVIATLPEATQKHFRKPTFNLDISTFHRVAYLLFIETERNKISVRGTHRLGASSISTVFEGTLSFNVEKLARATDHSRDYWHSSLGVAPDLAKISISKFLLVEPPSTNDKKRKKLGAYFTPTPLCDFLIEKLNFTIISGSHPVAIDPTCGTGQFLLAYLRKLANSNDNQVEVLARSIVGNDIEPMALFVSSYRINSFLSRVIGKMNQKSLNLHCVDFTSPQKVEELKKNLPKINHVIGNPPFGADGNSHPSYSNTWQSCLDHSTMLGSQISVGLVLPASFANTGEIKDLRNDIISKAGRFMAVAFDTRPTPIFPDNDQRPIFISFDYGVKFKSQELWSGGYRRHVKAKSITQSLQEIQWQPIAISETKEIFPLPSTEGEAKLIRVAFDVLNKKNEQIEKNESASKKSLKQDKKKNKDFVISVLSYGRYNMNAIIGEPPRGGGNKWKKYYFDSEEAAARMVVGLNSNLGWSLFRSLTNGLDFNKRLVDLIGAMPNGVGKGASCIKVAIEFSNKMRKSYETEGTFELAGRHADFTKLNKTAESAFGLKKLGVSVEPSSDTERTRVLKNIA